MTDKVQVHKKVVGLKIIWEMWHDMKIIEEENGPDLYKVGALYTWHTIERPDLYNSDERKPVNNDLSKVVW